MKGSRPPNPADALDGEEFARLEAMFARTQQALEARFARTGEASAAGGRVGLLSVPELDGFLTAIVSGPEVVMPSTWLPAIWGEGEWQFETEEEAQSFMSLIFRHSNAIADCLMQAPEQFEPIVHQIGEVGEDGKARLWLQPWCDGYLEAVTLSVEAWRAADAVLGDALAPIVEASSMFETDEADADREDLADQSHLLPAVAEAARKVHALLLRERARQAPGPAPRQGPARRTKPRVGRNAPCPCGSGKKYKHCCLH